MLYGKVVKILPCECNHDTELRSHVWAAVSSCTQEKARSCVFIEQPQKYNRKSEGSVERTFLPIATRRLTMNDLVLVNSFSHSVACRWEHTTDGEKNVARD